MVPVPPDNTKALTFTFRDPASPIVFHRIREKHPALDRLSAFSTDALVFETLFVSGQNWSGR